MLAWLGCDSQFNNTPGANQSQRAGPAPTAPTAAALIPPRPHPVRGRHSGPPSPQPSLGPNITCRGNAAILRGKCYAQIRSKNSECGGGPTRYVVRRFRVWGPKRLASPDLARSSNSFVVFFELMCPNRAMNSGGSLSKPQREVCGRDQLFQTSRGWVRRRAPASQTYPTPSEHRAYHDWYCCLVIIIQPEPGCTKALKSYLDPGMRSSSSYDSSLAFTA